MSNALFTIDDDELDLGDEDFLLEACQSVASSTQIQSSVNFAQKNEAPETCLDKNRNQTEHNLNKWSLEIKTGQQSNKDPRNSDPRTPLSNVNCTNAMQTPLSRDIEYRNRRDLAASPPGSSRKSKNLQTGYNSNTHSGDDDRVVMPPCKRPVLETSATDNGYNFSARNSTPAAKTRQGDANPRGANSCTPSTHRTPTKPTTTCTPLSRYGNKMNMGSSIAAGRAGAIVKGSVTPEKVVTCEALAPALLKTPLSSASKAKTRRGTPGSITRKFPGPAGLLPKLGPGDKLQGVMSPKPLENQSPNPTPKTKSLTSFTTDDDFQGDTWQAMMKEVKSAGIPLMMQFTVTEVLQKAALQQLCNGKVPYLCTLIKSFSVMGSDASVILKDQTGEIHGTVHRKALEAFHGELGAGAGILLKQVSVFSPSPRKHYINITPANILKIYSPDPEQLASSQPLTTQCTQEIVSSTERDLVELMEDEDELLAEIQDEDILQQADSVPVDQQFQDLVGVLDDDDEIFNDAELLL